MPRSSADSLYCYQAVPLPLARDPISKPRWPPEYRDIKAWGGGGLRKTCSYFAEAVRSKIRRSTLESLRKSPGFPRIWQSDPSSSSFTLVWAWRKKWLRGWPPPLPDHLLANLRAGEGIQSSPLHLQSSRPLPVNWILNSDGTSPTSVIFVTFQSTGRSPRSQNKAGWVTTAKALHIFFLSLLDRAVWLSSSLTEPLLPQVHNGTRNLSVK